MISHEHKCVFVHIPKTGGQSIEKVFLDDLGLSWQTRAPLLLRSNNCPELGPPRLAHLKAGEYTACRYLPKTLFDDYFKFSVIRNPWARVVSLYQYLNFNVSFNAFLTRILPHAMDGDRHWFVRPQSDFIYDEDDNLLVDFVARLENIEADFAKIRTRLKLDAPLNRVNVSKERVLRKKQIMRQFYRACRHRDWLALATLVGRKQILPQYQDYYRTPAMIRAVERLYERDINVLGYDFDGVIPVALKPAPYRQQRSVMAMPKMQSSGF